jgi:hypothetical protein
MILVTVVLVLVSVFADVNLTLRRRPIGTISRDVERSAVPNQIRARNVDVNRLMAEADLEPALFGLAGGGIGYIRRIAEILEAFVGVLCEFLM